MKYALAAILAFSVSTVFAQATPVKTDSTRTGSTEQSNPVLTKDAKVLVSTSGAPVVTDVEKAEKFGAYSK